MYRIFNRQGSLFNPFILALPFAILAIFFLPDIYQKFDINIEQSYNSSDKFIQKFIEFDGDGLSEKVILHSISNPIPTLPHISIYSATDAPQYDILLNHPWVKENNLFSADLNGNKKKELFVFLDALAEEKSRSRKKVTWEDITGVISRNSDASGNHDKYLKGSL